MALAASSLEAQQPASQQGAGAGKRARAVRVANGSVDLDGVLDEAVWASAPAISDFSQKEPQEGAPATEPTEIRFIYDDEALYIGARMRSRDPGAIQAPLARRDDTSAAEYIMISLDTFLDRRTAYTFGVTASGVRMDRSHVNDSETGDSGFDPVWQAESRIDEEGWTAELWIPYTQLRFNAQDQQTWGLNVARFIPNLEEEDYWAVVPKTGRGWASHFGNLDGIAGIRPTRRIELLPFIVGSATMDANRDEENPFTSRYNPSTRVGMDFKMGVGPNLTLDATINPDFGQVEADPAEVNLTAFATRFREQRPFFNEGAELLTLNQHPNVFYSRRIGSPPAGRANGDYVDAPTQSAILGTAKLTGRLPSGTSIGVLGALTREEHARVYEIDTEATTDVRVAPQTGYAVVKLEQELGASGSTASVLVGGVHRMFEDADPLANLLSRNALVYGGDFLWRLGGGAYEWAFTGVGSYVEGDAPAIALIQQSSAHNLQRPDRKYNIFDPTLTSMSGFSTLTSFNKVTGRHWLYGARVKFDHPTYDTNDIAQLNNADGIQPTVNVTYRETQPNSVLRNYSVRLNWVQEWNWGWDRQNNAIGSTVDLTWLNFWTSSFSLTRNLATKDSGLTRGGPLAGGPRRWTGSLNIGNPASSLTRVSGSLNRTSDELGGWSNRASINMSVRPKPQWQLSLTPSYTQSKDSQQYVTTLTGGREETFGRRYIFSYIDRTTISTQVRLSYTVRPDLTFDLYMEPFAASGDFYDYGELSSPGSLERIKYGESGTTLVTNPDGSQTVTAHGATFRLDDRDFNTRSFNSNAVVRWEWLPGSTMYLVWQQQRSEREILADPVGFGDAFRSFTVPGTNILLFKTSWWLPIK